MGDSPMQAGELPTAAQIPLQSFELPQFPAHASALRALTLTCDIPLDNYTSYLTQPFSVTDLPSQIESLTLELFSLGFPAGFLSQLAEKLPNLREIVLFQQLLGGVSTETQQDAVAFFERVCPSVRSLHLLDVFAPPGVIGNIGATLRKSEALKFLEVNYTTRHEEDFTGQIPGQDLPSLISPGLVSCALNISPSEVEEPGEKQVAEMDGNTKDDVVGKPEGAVPLGKSQTAALFDALTDDTSKPVELKVLNLTLFPLTLDQLRQLVSTHPGLLVLNATLELEPESSTGGDEEWSGLKSELLEILAICKHLEQVELVGIPGLQFSIAMNNPRRKAFQRIWPNEEEMQRLSEKCPKLALFQGSMLRRKGVGSVDWRLESGEWTGGVQHPLLESAESMGTVTSVVEKA